MSGDTLMAGSVSSQTKKSSTKNAPKKQPILYVTDTSTFIADPKVITAFQENHVFIPSVVIEELNNQKDDKDPKFKNRAIKAQHALGEIDRLTGTERFDEGWGVKTPGGGMLQSLTDYRYKLPGNNIMLTKNDSYILRAAMCLQRKNPDKKVVVVSLDKGMRDGAKSYGLSAETYKNMSVDLAQITDGIHNRSVTSHEIQMLKERSFLKKDPQLIPVKEALVPVVHPNEFVYFKNHQDDGLWGIDQSGKMMSYIKPERILGYGARDYMQEAAIHLGLSDLPCVLFRGEMGTGKTFLAVLCALQLLLDKKYEKIVIFRSLSTLGGKDLGFFPGDLGEKINPYARAILDEFHDIRDKLKKSAHRLADQVNEIIETRIHIDTVSLVQGKNIRKSVVLVDDAQNFDVTETKGYVSRLSEDAKIIITGDEKQVADTRYLDETTTGFVHLIRAMSGSHVFGHVTLKEVYRSPLVKEVVARW